MKAPLVFCCALAAISSIGQIEIDRKLVLTGTDDQAKIEGIQEVLLDEDAANKKYVDERTFSHYIGELYGGGIVFHQYRENGVEHGLIVSLHNVNWWSAWSNVTSGSASATSNINGMANTVGITSQSGHSASPAKNCLDYSHGEFDDWYLPSHFELTKLGQQLFDLHRVIETDVTYHTFDLNFYWSSTEAWWNNTQAFRLSTLSGTMEVVPKTGSSQNNIVRCIRKF